MSVFDFLKQPKKGAPSTQIAELEGALDRLRIELKAAEKIVAEHPEKRAAMLTSAASNADIKKLDADMEDALLSIERLEAAETELITRLEHAKDTAERERLAGEQERAASAIEEKSRALEGPIAALAAAFAELLKAIPADTSITVSATQPATSEDVARAILASGLYTALPSIFEMVPCRPHLSRLGGAAVERALFVHTFADGLMTTRCNGLIGEECTIHPASITASGLIVDPLRRRAAALRGGDAERLAAAE